MLCSPPWAQVLPLQRLSLGSLAVPPASPGGQGGVMARPALLQAAGCGDMDGTASWDQINPSPEEGGEESVFRSWGGRRSGPSREQTSAQLLSSCSAPSPPAQGVGVSLELAFSSISKGFVTGPENLQKSNPSPAAGKQIFTQVTGPPVPPLLDLKTEMRGVDLHIPPFIGSFLLIYLKLVNRLAEILVQAPKTTQQLFLLPVVTSTGAPLLCAEGSGVPATQLSPRRPLPSTSDARKQGTAPRRT